MQPKTHWKINPEIAKSFRLSPREKSYTELAASGAPDKAIARAWGTGVQNVRNVAQAARDKLHAYSRVELVTEAIRHSILVLRQVLLFTTFAFASTGFGNLIDTTDPLARLNRNPRSSRSSRARSRKRRDELLDTGEYA